jgi:hypothetical protein
MNRQSDKISNKKEKGDINRDRHVQRDR